MDLREASRSHERGRRSRLDLQRWRFVRLQADVCKRERCGSLGFRFTVNAGDAAITSFPNICSVQFKKDDFSVLKLLNRFIGG